MIFTSQKKILETLMINWEASIMTREELKEQIDELMQQYANEEIDGDTYACLRVSDFESGKL